MEHLDLIQNRRREVDGQIARLQAQIDALHTEQGDLEVAERVIAGLSGAKRLPARPANQSATSSASGRNPAAEVTWADKVYSVLTDAYERQGQASLSPKEIGDRIERKFKIKVKGSYISSIVWRMWFQQHRLTRVSEGLYALPKTNEATDLLSSTDRSAASEAPNGTKGREVAPGGGT